MDGHQEQQNYIDPHYNMMADMSQHQQQQPQMQQYYQQPAQPMLQQPQQTNPLPVNFTTFTPDPNVMAFQGQPYPPQLTMLSQNPMPLLPTEPIPQTSLKGEKKKTPTKAKKKEQSPSGQVPFKKIPEYVQKLLQKRHPGFQDKEFAERALSNLARKLASQAAVLDEWVRAVEHADQFSGCVCVIRPKDGRMTITKATGNAGCKKVFPQIFVCQLFRWPQIVFHHDIKSSSHCQHPGVIKPSTTDTKEEVICVNPYHYDLNTEVEPNRTKSKQSKQNKNQSPMNSCEDIDSDDEILPYEDDGIDYIKLWDEKSIKPKSVDKQVITFENLMKELNFFTLHHESKKLIPCEAEQNLTEDIKTFLLSGKYKSLIENMPEKPKVRTAKDRDLMPPPTTQPMTPSSSNSGTKASVPTPVIEEEDSAIQNLLDDIRGSFERQFDDEFNDFHEEGSRSSSPFGNINIGTTFSMSDGHALEDLAVSAEDILASSPDEMPLEGWTMSQEVFDNFLEAASHSGGDGNAGGGGNHSADQFNFNNQQLHHDSNQHF